VDKLDKRYMKPPCEICPGDQDWSRLPGFWRGFSGPREAKPKKQVDNCVISDVHFARFVAEPGDGISMAGATGSHHTVWGDLT